MATIRRVFGPKDPSVGDYLDHELVCTIGEPCDEEDVEDALPDDAVVTIYHEAAAYGMTATGDYFSCPACGLSSNDPTRVNR